MPTYDVTLIGLPGSAGLLPTSASGGPSSWVNLNACSEPILFRRGDSNVTVTKFPPASISVKLTIRDSGIRIRGSDLRLAEPCRVGGHDADRQLVRVTGTGK